MSISQAFTFMGGEVQFEDLTASPVAFKTVAEVQKTSLSGNNVKFADVTNIQSPDNYAEVIPTIIEGGELSFEANFVPGDDSQGDLYTIRDAREKRNWKIVLPDSLGYLAFAGYVAAVDTSLDFGKEGKLSVKIKISGKVTPNF